MSVVLYNPKPIILEDFIEYTLGNFLGLQVQPEDIHRFCPKIFMISWSSQKNFAPKSQTSMATDLRSHRNPGPAQPASPHRLGEPGWGLGVALVWKGCRKQTQRVVEESKLDAKDGKQHGVYEDGKCMHVGKGEHGGNEPQQMEIDNEQQTEVNEHKINIQGLVDCELMNLVPFWILFHLTFLTT